MDNKTANSFLKKVEQHARKIHSSSPEDNGENCSFESNCTPIEVKEEIITDEIQEYAATTMSELLGWYGYDKVDSGCTRSLNLDHFTSTLDTRSSQMVKMDENFILNKQAPKSPLLNATNSPFDVSKLPLPHSVSSLNTVDRQLISPPLPMKKVSLDSTSTIPYKNYSGSICSENISCSWCGRITQICKSGRTNSLSYNMINTLGHFCSEACFAAGRAVFKQAKTCDWCRHIRNSGSHVDFQDDESQLQFCSDKCLNQYKMNIFCHETQTHLMLQGLNNVSCHDTEKGNLITPELWFRSCQSPLNSSTENTFIEDEHVTSNLSSPSHDKGKEKNQNEIEKSLESNRKAIRKRDSFCIRICTKVKNNNKKKINFHTDINKNDVKEDIKEPTLVTEENKFDRFVNNQNHCKINCTEKTVLNCKELEKDHRLMDVVNHDSYDHRHNNIFLEKNIHVKNIKDLLKEKEHDLSENVLRSPSWFATSTAPVMQCETPSAAKSFTDETIQIEYKKQTNASLKASSPVQLDQAESSIHTLSATLLPPVTVLVPYPIPVPIPVPIPIPIPIPTPILSKLMTGEQEVKDAKCKSLKCNNSIKNKCSVSCESQLCINTNVSMTETSQHATAAKLSFSLSPSNTKNENNDNQRLLKYNTKPPRKRKRSNETKLQLKRKNKFIPA
ncbi:sine oculis-binding protein [Colletes latitarsis]|uniref:sine oculis-binding protein n=1 Tax=Colletes latitarsis TaxID=2605962 RepID=UPI00403537A1